MQAFKQILHTCLVYVRQDKTSIYPSLHPSPTLLCVRGNPKLQDQVSAEEGRGRLLIRNNQMERQTERWTTNREIDTERHQKAAYSEGYWKRSSKKEREVFTGGNMG